MSLWAELPERVSSYCLGMFMLWYFYEGVLDIVLWQTFPVTVLGIGLLRGREGLLDEIRGIAYDLYCCGSFIAFVGYWPPHSGEASTLKWRWLLGGAQFSALLSGYFLSYGVLSMTVCHPLQSLYDTLEVFDWTSEDHWWWLCRRLPTAGLLGVFYCSLANVTSHRYFSHCSFRASRPFTAVLACAASMSGQKGCLWWSSQHRVHHRSCGSELDPHSQTTWGFLYAHMGWLLDRRHFRIYEGEVANWYRDAPELLVIEILSFAIDTITMQLFNSVFGVWTVVIGRALSLHYEGLINSYCHTGQHDACGTKDSLVVAWLTGGEGFHVQHHADASCASHGWSWGSVNRCIPLLDVNYLVICLFELSGLAWDVKHPRQNYLSSKTGAHQE